MTSSLSELAAFSNLLKSGQVRQNRRDFLRVSAIAAAATLPANGVYARPATHQLRLQAETDTGFSLRLPFNPYGQPVTVDPHRTVNWGPFWVMLPYAWSGLLRFDENGAVEADLADSIEPNDDGSMYVAKLREGIAFADGTPILAEHFVASWKRALDSTRLSPMFRFMEPIVGASEIAQGDSIPLGAVATDERTIEISLTSPLAHFPSYLATFGFAVVHPSIDDETEPIAWGDACSGAWMIADFSDSGIVMVPNPHHWSETSADVSEIVWHVAPGGTTDQTILEWYENDEIAVADAPVSLLPTMQENDVLAPELTGVGEQSSTMVLALDFHQQPFDDVRVRRAVAAAIDREAWCNDIELGTYVPASSFTPPVLGTIAGYEAPVDSFDDEPETLLADAGLDPEASEDEIVFFQPATDSPEAIDRNAKLIAMISNATGLQITHDTALTTEQITAARQDAGGLQITLMQWQLDSDQPSLLNLLTQESDYNAGWVNWEPNLENMGDYTPGADAEKFNELVTKAASTMDAEERNQAYSDAEALLLKNAVLIPIGFWNPRYLQKSWLQGTRQGPWSGSTPVRIDTDVTIDAASLPSTAEA